MDVIDMLQVEVYNKLSEAGYNVLDVPDINTPFPFVKLGDMTCETEKNKLGKIYGYDITYQLNVWTEQGDKQVSNYMVNHIANLLLEIKIENCNIIDIDTTVSHTDYKEARKAVVELFLKLDI